MGAGTRSEVRLSGFGGQGLVLAGIVLGRAAAVHEGRNAVLAQSYGPESRGGASCAELVLDDGPIDYPHVVHPDLVLVLSQEAYATYGRGRSPSALLVVEQDLVQVDSEAERGRRVLSAPFTAMAETLGRRLVLNMVALGFLAGCTDLVSAQALREAIQASVPPGTEALNLRAFEAGLARAQGREEAAR
jgi:2-oxoglutarate ferredoxin oxidoreductase subunit gamma